MTADCSQLIYGVLLALLIVGVENGIGKHTITVLAGGVAKLEVLSRYITTLFSILTCTGETDEDAVRLFPGNLLCRPYEHYEGKSRD